MATLLNNQPLLYVVHPLDDAPEVKREVDALGLMPMSPLVRACLGLLRAYLVAMGALVLYQALHLAGALPHV